MHQPCFVVATLDRSAKHPIILLTNRPICQSHRMNLVILVQPANTCNSILLPTPATFDLAFMPEFKFP